MDIFVRFVVTGGMLVNLMNVDFGLERVLKRINKAPGVACRGINNKHGKEIEITLCPRRRKIRKDVKPDNPSPVCKF